MNASSADSLAFSIVLTALSNEVTISLDNSLSVADFNASLASFNVASCFLRASAFLSSSAFNASVSFFSASISSPKLSALSWSFSDFGRAASAFSASSIFAFKSAGRAFLSPEVAGVVGPSTPFASFSDGNASAASVALISPASIAFNKSSLPIVALTSSIALALSEICALLLTLSTASFSSFSNAAVNSALVSACFLASSASFLASSLALASASAALALAASKSASTAFLASSALVLAASASTASFFLASSLVFASLAAVVAVSTFVWASVTLASAVLTASLTVWVSVVSFGLSTCNSRSAVFLTTTSASLAWATAAPVVATPIPTSTDATPTLNLRNEYFLLY